LRVLNLFKKLLKGIGALVFVATTLSAINIIQAGKRNPDGRDVKDILEKNPEEATCDNIETLSRADMMQLFYAAEAPAFESLNGERHGKILRSGIFGGAMAYFADHVFPTGTLTIGTRWHGKAFNAEENNSGWGINVFSRKGEKQDQKVFYERKMRIYTGPTAIGKDGKDSFHLDYGAFNTDLTKTLHDEVRRINDNLYIGVGYMTVPGGHLSPVPFVLFGEPMKFPVT